MKAILEYNLPEEADEHKMALNGSKYWHVIETTLSLIRQKIKYENLAPEQEKLLEEIMDFINEEMTEL